MKIIEIADLHINPKWLEQQKPVLYTIIETGEKEKPDFICIVGDIFDRPFYNSDKDSISFILKFIADLQKIAPIIMITGTPSHDAPGSYTIFEKMGCHVLHPANPQIINGCLFIGFPEFDKTHFVNMNPGININNINSEINKMLNTFINSYWLPVREACKDKPCVFLGHGCFVDNPHDNNPIIKNSDIVIDNNKLAEIKADRYIFGHFHTPGESKILNGGYVGYMGFDRTPWNNTGFQPGFNVTEIDINSHGYENNPQNHGYHTKITRIDYPVIRREKIKMDRNHLKQLKQISYRYINADVRINLSIKKSDLIKIDIHEYEKEYKKLYNAHSCEIIPEIVKEESHRITHEQAEKINTLRQKYNFFKGWNNYEGKDGYYNKLYEIEKCISLKTQSQEIKKVKLLFLEVHGSIFSLDTQGKNTFSHDFSNDPEGLTLIAGDNGQGKSTYMGFALPYPVFIGWDYRSLKEFFPDGGYIKKRFDVNGVIHEHIIMISQKKIECFWNIFDSIFTGTSDQKGEKIKKWIPKIKASQLKDFMELCENFFGPLSSFISTSFFAQEPWRMKNKTSSITSSSATELRNAYHEIVGISREREKLYAREKKDNLKTEIEKLEIKKNTMCEFLKEKGRIEKEKNILLRDIKRLDSEIGVIVHDENEKQKEFDDIKNKYDEQQKIENKILNLKDKQTDKYIEKTNIQEKIKRLEKINITELNRQLLENQEIKNKIDFLRDQWQDISKKKNEILEDIKCNESAIYDCDIKINDYTMNINDLKNAIKTRECENDIWKKPCYYCGKIPDPENEKKINANIELNKMTNETIKEFEKELKQFAELKWEHESYIKQQRKELPDSELKYIEEEADNLKKQLLPEVAIIHYQNAINEYSQIKVYQENLNIILADIMELNCQINDLTGQKNPFIEDQYNITEKELSELKTELQNKSNELSSKNAILKEKKKQLKQIEIYENNILELTKKLEVLKTDCLEWETIEKDMQPHKLPALELELIAQEIDFQVNQKLDGRYIIKTVTQDINKDGDVIDRFNILVYNPKSGIEKPLLAHSPGQRAAYFIEPVSQALREKRQQREKVIFTWSVADETDWPIKPLHIRDYYEIMAAGLSQDHTRFIMSQKSEVEQFIKNIINIEDIGKDI